MAPHIATASARQARSKLRALPAEPPFSTDQGGLLDLVQASQDHLDDCRYRNLSPKSIRLYAIYESSFLEYLRSRELPLGMRSLSTANVKACSEWIRTRHVGKRGGEYASRTFVGVMKTLSAWLCDQEQILLDPLARLPRPKVTKVARAALELHEVQAIRGAMSETNTALRDIAITSLLLATGLRMGEVCQLTLDDVDLQACTLQVVAKGRVERVLRFGDGSRSGGRTAQRLRDYLKSRRAMRTRGFFLNRDGRPLTQSGFGSAWRKACLQAGIKRTEVHRTRHTFATRYLVTHPGDETGLRHLLGHLSADEYRTYTTQAGRILAEINGDEVGAASMLDVRDDTAPARRTPAARENRSATSHDVLADYVSQTEPGAAAVADTARAPQPKGRALPEPQAAALAPAGARIRCPFCAEDIMPEAKKCRYCGEWLNQSGRGAA